jgi:hypothetical protein
MSKPRNRSDTNDEDEKPKQSAAQGPAGIQQTRSNGDGITAGALNMGRHLRRIPLVPAFFSDSGSGAKRQHPETVAVVCL